MWAANASGAVQVATDNNTKDSAKYFNLVVREVRAGQVVNLEVHRNLSMDKADSRYAVSVVNSNSDLVRLTDLGIGEMPTASGTDVVNSPGPSSFTALAGSPSDGDVPGSSAWNTSGVAALKGGLAALDKIAPFIFNILSIPAAASLPSAGMTSVVSEAIKYCRDHRAFYLADIPADTDTAAEMTTFMSTNASLRDRNAAIYFPRLEIPDALNENRPRNVAASGTIAGIYAQTDSARGVWKAPAGTEAVIRGANVPVRLTDLENGALNPQGVNVLRTFPVYGSVVWGARTMDGADQQASEWKYVPVRRTALYIEESLSQGLKWVVFEPNDEPLWSQIRLNAGAFMQDLFRQGAFQGTTPRDAYFVKCDRDTTTQSDINKGIVNIVVGFAPLRPAEFVVIKIQQMAGQIQA